MLEFTRTCAAKGNYVCPPDAGPAWRAAYEAGINMEQLEANLRLTVEERFLKHDKLLNEWFEFETFMEKIHRNWKAVRVLNRQSQI
jgi:hypothetical protein